MAKKYEMQVFFKKNKDKDTLLLTHHNADIDAVASVILLGYYLKKLGFKKITYGTVEGISLQARNLLKYSSKKFVDKPDLKRFEMVVILDTSTKNQLGEVDISRSNLVVVDHHQGASSFRGKKFIDSKSVSTTQLIYNSFSIPLTKKIAKVLLIGIIFDSAYLKIADNKTFLLVAWLLNKFNITYSEIISEFSLPPSYSERIARIKSAQRCKLHKIGRYLIATSRVGSFEAAAARSLVGLGADVAFVASDSDGARISSRAHTNFINKVDLNLGKIMEETGRVIGGSGSGHKAAAGANGPDKEKIDEALDLCLQLVKKKIENERKKSG